MIMSFSYLVDVADREPVEIAEELVQRLTRFNSGLRGLKAQRLQGQLRIVLRVAGLTRWDIQRDAPKILGILLRKLQIPASSAKFESMIMEPGRSHLKNGQGRTEMTRRPRAERMADGRPWDHIEWEGDDFSAEGPAHDSP